MSILERSQIPVLFLTYEREVEYLQKRTDSVKHHSLDLSLFDQKDKALPCFYQRILRNLPRLKKEIKDKKNLVCDSAFFASELDAKISDAYYCSADALLCSNDTYYIAQAIYKSNVSLLTHKGYSVFNPHRDSAKQNEMLLEYDKQFKTESFSYIIGFCKHMKSTKKYGYNFYHTST